MIRLFLMTAFHTWLFVLSGSYWRGLPQLAGYSAHVYSSYQSELSHATPPCHVPDQTPAKEQEIKTHSRKCITCWGGVLDLQHYV